MKTKTKDMTKKFSFTWTLGMIAGQVLAVTAFIAIFKPRDSEFVPEPVKQDQQEDVADADGDGSAVDAASFKAMLEEITPTPEPTVEEPEPKEAVVEATEPEEEPQGESESSIFDGESEGPPIEFLLRSVTPDTLRGNGFSLIAVDRFGLSRGTLMKSRGRWLLENRASELGPDYIELPRSTVFEPLYGVVDEREPSGTIRASLPRGRRTGLLTVRDEYLATIPLKMREEMKSVVVRLLDERMLVVGYTDGLNRVILP